MLLTLFFLLSGDESKMTTLTKNPGEVAGVPGHTPMAAWVFLTRVRFSITKLSGGRERTAMHSHDHENGNLTLLRYQRPLVGYQRPPEGHSRPLLEDCAGFTQETDCKVVLTPLCVNLNGAVPYMRRCILSHALPVRPLSMTSNNRLLNSFIQFPCSLSPLAINRPPRPFYTLVRNNDTILDLGQTTVVDAFSHSLNRDSPLLNIAGAEGHRQDIFSREYLAAPCKHHTINQSDTDPPWLLTTFVLS